MDYSYVCVWVKELILELILLNKDPVDDVKLS